MSKFIKILGSLISVLVIILLFLFIYIYFSSKTMTNGGLVLNGVHDTVNIHRDQYGVPHIEALNDGDAFFALGYVHAQDRLWQMEMQRHIVQGSLSEIFGETTLAKDKFLRTFGFYRAAKTAWESLPYETKNLFRRYTQGVNSFIESGKLPLQFKIIGYQPTLWDDVDSIAWQKMMAWDLQGTWQEKVENYVIASEYGKEKVSIFLPQYPKDAPTILKDKDLNKYKPNIGYEKNDFKKTGEILQSTYEDINLGFQNLPGKGSNNWVISGNLTDSSKPLLANDPHLSMAAPMLWYLADIKTPNFHSIGATIPGLPLVVIGHNQHISWGVTNGCIDVQDLYIEQSDTKFITINEIIKVKGKEDVVFPVQLSKHGPIISSVSSAGKIGKHVALKWPALEAGDTSAHSFLKISYAKNWNDFQDALSYYVTPSQNFIYADIKGNIGYYLPGKIPIREGWSGAFPIDSRDNLEWKSYIPFHELPHVYNPSDNYIATANNKIISDDMYPYRLTFRCQNPPYRAERIEDLIKQKKKLTKADMEKIQYDTVSYLWKELRSIMLKTSPEDEGSKIALEKLKNWDGDLSMSSDSATIFTYWYKELNRMLPEKILEVSKRPEPLFIKQQLEDNGEFCKTKYSEDCSSFLSYSLKQAMILLTKQQGHDEKNWVWGNVHKVIFKEMGLGESKYIGWIWNRKIATPGDSYTVNVGTYDYSGFNQVLGAGYRQIVDLNNFNNSVYIQALGQSEDIFSKNYDDLMSLWRDGKYIPMSTSKEMWGKYDTLVMKPN